MPKPPPCPRRVGSPHEVALWFAIATGLAIAGALAGYFFALAGPLLRALGRCLAGAG